MYLRHFTPTGAISQRVWSVGKRTAKGVIGWLYDRVRHIPGVPLARGKVSASEVLAGAHPNIDRADFQHSFQVKEQVPDDQSEPRHRPIDTLHFVLDTRDPRYSCRNNVVIGPGNLVIYEDGIPFKEMSIRLRVLEKPRRISGSVGYLSNADPNNYHHWFAFMLPLMGTYRDRLGIDPDYYYVGRPVRPFHLEALARAGVGPERVLSDAVVADRLVADSPDRKRRDGAVDGPMLEFSRRLYFEQPTRTPARRLYVGRGEGSRRRLTNEPQLTEHAARHGFEVVNMDGRAVADQARLFGEAAFIIAPHGAALTNILFADPGASVLELLPARPTPSVAIDAPLLSVFREICAFVGCRYDCVFGERLSSQQHIPQSNADFSIPFEAFRDRLAAMLSSAN
jgi:Glycosyltransferase 61